MAISDDLRSVRTMLETLSSLNTADGASLIRLAGENLSSLADQVEALESVPLAPFSAHSSYQRSRPAAPHGGASRLFVMAPARPADVPLQ